MDLEFDERTSNKKMAEEDNRDDGSLNERILIDERVFNSEDFDLVEKLFDENGIRYDFDSGDRIMVSSEDVNTVIEILDNAGIYAERV